MNLFLTKRYTGKIPSRGVFLFLPTTWKKQRTPDRNGLSYLGKDVLRTGRWLVSDDKGEPVWWEVKPETLHLIASEFNRAKGLGVRFNVCWDHGDTKTGVVSSKNLISQIDKAWVKGERLWIASWIPRKVATSLRTNRALKVSARVKANYTDGAGRHYPVMLLHVGVVDRPVISDQGPWIQLAQGQASKGGKNMDFEKVKTVINKLLEQAELGIQIPDSADESNINLFLDMILGMMGASTTEEEPTEGEPTEPVDESLSDDSAASGSGEDPKTRSLSQPFAGMKRRKSGELNSVILAELKALRTQVGTITLSQTEGRKSEYMKALNNLGEAGVLDGKMIQHYMKLGVQHDWNVGILAGFGTTSGTLDLSQKTKSFRNGQSPKPNVALDVNDRKQILLGARELGAQIPDSELS